MFSKNLPTLCWSWIAHPLSFYHPSAWDISTGDGQQQRSAWNCHKWIARPAWEVRSFHGAIVNIMMILMMIRDVGIRGHCLEYKLIFDTVLLFLWYIRFILSHHITEIHINIYMHIHCIMHLRQGPPPLYPPVIHPVVLFFQVWHGPEAYQGSHRRRLGWKSSTWKKVATRWQHVVFFKCQEWKHA